MANRLTPEQVEAFLNRYKDPANARRFLQEAGLIDENGELARPYRAETDAMDALRQASADVSGIELRSGWCDKTSTSENQ